MASKKCVSNACGVCRCKQTTAHHGVLFSGAGGHESCSLSDFRYLTNDDFSDRKHTHNDANRSPFSKQFHESMTTFKTRDQVDFSCLRCSSKCVVWDREDCRNELNECSCDEYDWCRRSSETNDWPVLKGAHHKNKQHSSSLSQTVLSSCRLKSPSQPKQNVDEIQDIAPKTYSCLKGKCSCSCDVRNVSNGIITMHRTSHPHHSTKDDSVECRRVIEKQTSGLCYSEVLTGGSAFNEDHVLTSRPKSKSLCQHSRQRTRYCEWWRCLSGLLLSLLVVSGKRSMLVVCLLFLCIASPASGQLRPDTDIRNHREEGVCQSVDVRNDVSSFSRLRGCRVVEGFVQILLIDHANESSYANISFPELREITGYLMLYRVNGLRSIGKLFPNLAVIRGHTLFIDYALIVYEMIHLQEVGLYSLTDVLRGSVRIEKNPLLCYVDTIDWDLIAVKGEQRYIKDNRRKNDCPMCGEKLCSLSQTTKEPLCWNRQYCQIVCPRSCGSRSCYNGECCHESCLGGCHGPGPNNCFVCRDVVLQKKCIKSCPSNTYKYQNRRCIQELECLAMPAPKEQHDHLWDKPWKPFKDECILDCPNGYVEVLNRQRNISQCEPCQGPCRKECEAANVDSIASAQKLKFCTYIKGSLEIQIKGGKNIVKELEEGLSMIEEIEGYLKIARSFPLISLNFLKKLRVIHGKILENGRYSFIVLDNQNLQELWDWENRAKDLKILGGRPFFHFNPKLCLDKIEVLKQIANLSAFTDLEVAQTSNGDKVACNVTTFKPNVIRKTPTAVLIEWQNVKLEDFRSLLGYVIYSTEAPFKNVTLYDGRDACGADGWKVADVAVAGNDTLEVFHLLTYLKPYTQYAYYVKTYTIATMRTGAQSNIQYFMTEPDIPSIPQNLQAYSNSSSTLVIQWQPPAYPNGNVTYYIITGTWEKYDQEVLKQRNYCADPLMPPDKKSTHTVPQEKQEKTSKDNCSCEDKEDQKIPVETDALSRIHFEDTLHNMVYIKRTPQKRRKREIALFQSSSKDFYSKSDIESTMIDGNMSAPFSSPNMQAANKIVAGVYHMFELKVSGANTYVMHNLSHFAEYTIAVQACRERTADDLKNTTVCSTKSIVTSRTLEQEGADDVDNRRLVVEVWNRSLGMVKLKWEEPQQPNGIVITYQIEYRRVDIENYKPTVECITRNHFLEREHSYILNKLAPGNYSLRLRATSLAGSGLYTTVRYFYIQDIPSTSGIEMLVGAIVGTFLVAAAIFLIVVYVRRKYLPGVPNMKLIASVNPEYVSTGYVPDEWEVPRKKIEMLQELGQGSFGMVYEGIGRDIVEGLPEIRCAIKTVNEQATDRERSEFLNEASVMKAFNTHHVVRLLGVVSQGQPVLVVMELMAFGDLKTYLRSHRPDVSDEASKQPPTLKRILQMAIEIADGMAYLAAKKFVHRDLAARNCMVAGDLTVKIGDFGMTRDIYETDYYRKGTKGLLPVRWMAPESLKDGVFTSFSDVWSYGVVLWEMATLASQPYQGLSNDQVLRYVIEGGVMERPDNCPDRLYELMRLCWQHKPITRPPFLELVTLLLPDVGPAFSQVSFYHKEEGQELRSVVMVPSDDPSTPLRVTRDIEDFSLGGSDLDEGDVDDDDEDDEEGDEEETIGMFPPSPRQGLGSPGSKIGNGSTAITPTTATTPTTANGWVVGRQNNGTNNGTTATIKTTEC